MNLLILTFVSSMRSSTINLHGNGLTKPVIHHQTPLEKRNQKLQPKTKNCGSEATKFSTWLAKSS